MTTTVTVDRTLAIANGSAAIPFDFQALSADEIGVTRNGVLADPSTYTVVVNGDGTGMVTPVSTWGTDAIVIYSSPSYQQTTEFTRFGPMYPDQFNGPLDRAARTSIRLANRVQGLEDTVGDAVADLALRADLLDLTGATRVMTSSGETVEVVSQRPHRLAFGALKTRAYSRPTAVTLSQDLSYMKGWAKNAGTTGGAGLPTYWVTRSSDDPNTPGTLRYALSQVSAGGGGNILFDPRGELDIILVDRIPSLSNYTIDAPGRNVRIRTNSNVAIALLSGTNCIMRRVELAQLIDPTGINNKLNSGDPGYNAAYGGPADQFDALTVVPTTADKIWIDELTIQHVSDGAIDIASSLLTHLTTANCRASVSRTIIRGQYKAMLCGTSSTDPLDTLYTSARQLFVSFYENWYDHCAERMPRVSGLGYADSVNNSVDICQLETDDGTATGAYGAASLYGGWLRTRGDLFRSLDGVATLAVQTSDGATIPQSATINEGSVAEGALVIQTRNTGTPTALPGSNYDLTPVAVPVTTAARDAWRKSIQAAAGARCEAMPAGNWIYDPASALPLNGITVRAATDHGLVGRYILVERQQETVPQPEALTGATTAPIWTRGSTKTLAADVLTIDGTAPVWAVNPESGSTDDIVTINGMADNQVAIIRPAASTNVLTVRGTGNIALPTSGVFALNGNKESMLVRYDAGIGKVVVVAQPKSGANPIDLGALGVSASNSASVNAAIVNAYTSIAGRGQWLLLPAGDIPMGRINLDSSHRLEGRGQGTDGKPVTGLIFDYGVGKGINFKAVSVGDAGAQRGSLRNVRIDFTGTPLANGVANFSTGSPNTITVTSGSANFSNGQFVALEGAGKSLTVQDRTVAMTSGGNTATVADPLGTGSNPGVYVGQPVTVTGAGTAGADLVGFVGTWGPTSFTVVNSAGAALNAGTTVTAAAYTIKFPLFGEITAGGGTGTLTISTGFQTQNVTGGVLRHMDCGVFASCTIDGANVEINAQGSAGILSAGGNCDLFLYGISSEGTSADCSQFWNVKTGGNLGYAGVIAYGNDAQAMSFHGCNFAGPKISVLDQSFLGNSFFGCHWAFNVGIVVAVLNAQTSIFGGYMEAGTSYIAQPSSLCSFFSTFSMKNASGWQGVDMSTGSFTLPGFASGRHTCTEDVLIGRSLKGCSGTGMARFVGTGANYPLGTSVTGVSIYYNSGRDSGVVAADDGAVNKVLELVGSKVQMRPGNVATGEWDNALGGLNMLAGKVIFNSGTQVLGPRDTGWTADTGTAEKTAHATYAAGTTLTFGATYVQAEHTAMATRLAAVETALQSFSRGQKAVKDAALTHGFFGA